MPTYATDNFTGGLNRISPERLSVTESSKQQNLLHSEGGLRSIDGRNLYNQTAIIASTQVKNLYRFYKTGHRVNDDSATTKQGWTLARCGAYVWLACECLLEPIDAAAVGATSVVVTTAANVKEFPTSGTLIVHPGDDTTPYQLAYTAKNETTGALTVSALTTAIPEDSTVDIVDFRPILYTSGNTNSCGFANVNGRCYIACDGMYRWDGFYYAVGKLSCTGNTTLTAADNDIDWATGVLPGDKVYYGNGATAPHTWYGPYTVSSVTAGTPDTITLTGDGQSTDGGTWDYIIVRMNNAGVKPSTYAPTLTAAAATATALDVHATYGYKYSYLYKSGGTTYETALSDDDTATTVDAGDYIKVGIPISWSPYAPYVGSLGVRIYRTEGGGSTYLKLADYWWPSGLYTPSTTTMYEYTDIIADASLGAKAPVSSVGTTVDIPNLAPTATKYGSGSQLDVGTHYYKYTIYNSLTDTESNASPAASVTSTAGQQVTVTMPLTNADRQGDFVRVYRTPVSNSAVYYFVEDVAWTAGATSLDYVDKTVSDATLITHDILSEDHDSAPEDVNRCLYFNGRLYAWTSSGVTTTYQNRLYFSTVASPEYWPGYQFGIDDPQFDDATVGGYVDIGSTGERLTMVKPESGSFSESGSTGANLLIQTKTRAFQWWGKDWADHRLDEAWAEGCACGDTAANCGGVLAWLTKNGPVLKPMGSPLPVRVYEKIFPPLRYPFSEQVTKWVPGDGSGDYYDLSSGAYWRDYYVFTWCQSTATAPNKMGMLHLPTMTYTEIGTTTYPCYARSLCVWDGPGDNGELYYGDNSGFVWRLFAKTGDYTYWTPSSATGVQCIHRTGSILAPRSPKELYHEKKAMDWTLVFQKPATNQTITPKIYIEGEETTAGWNNSGTVTETVSATADGGRYYAHLGESGLRGRSFMLEWSGTFTKTVVLEGMVLEYEQKERDET